MLQRPNQPLAPTHIFAEPNLSHHVDHLTGQHMSAGGEVCCERTHNMSLVSQSSDGHMRGLHPAGQSAQNHARQYEHFSKPDKILTLESSELNKLSKGAKPCVSGHSVSHTQNSITR